MHRSPFLRFAILFFILIISADHSFAQKLDSLSIDTDTKYPQEKLYLQYDRPYYNPGETIWFKAYLTASNLPSQLSKTVYAELINDKGVIMQRKIMPVIESGAASFFELPDTIKSNQLYVKAYTAWMLNFDSTLLYIKPIRIINNTAARYAPVKPVYDLTFFPEGGDLVAGIPSNVAFKAADQDAVPFNVSGTINDSRGTKLLSFNSSHDGMGHFSFTPLADETYKAVWKDKKGVARETLLPKIKKEGAVLTVSNDNAAIVHFSVERPDDATEDFKFFYVIAEMQQQLVYSAKLNLSAKTKVSAPIPVDSLADGIMKITIFNAVEVPVAERIVFINHNNYSFITDLHSLELNMGKRKKNVLQVDVGGTIVSNLSISVTDESLTTPLPNKETIYSQLLLSGDLRGSIYNAAQYFSSDEDSVKKQLDLVMLTNGWRRFKWEDILAGKMPALKYAPENNLSISGTVFGPAKNVLKGKEITGVLKTKNGSSDFFTIPVDQDGKFKLDHVILFDTAKLYYQFNGDKDKRLTSISTFNFNQSYVPSPKPSANWLASLALAPLPDTATIRKNRSINRLQLEQFIEGNKIKDLAVVTVKAKVKSPEEKMNDEYTSGFFSGSDGYTFITETDPFAKSAISILDYLSSKVAGMQVTTSGQPSITWRGSPTAVFLNEATSDIEGIQSISMNDVAMIKIFRPPFFGAGGSGAGGAVAVYLKKGGASNDNVKGLDFANIAGYSAIKEFYSPDYEKPLDINNPDDFRITLYWNPFLIFDKNNRRFKIPFYNSDNCKKIRVVIEGMNELGQLTREEKVFE
jgi:hypothetical protein